MANPIDAKVGKQITKRFDVGDVTRADVASALKITVEELHLIELGEQRADADSLKTLSEIFEIPLSYFYEESGDDNTLN